MYKEMFNEISLINEFCKDTVNRSICDKKEIEKIKESNRIAYETNIVRTKGNADQVKNQCTRIINERNAFIRSTKCEIKSLISSIDDPHFKKMEREYSREIGRSHIAVSGMNKDEIMRRVRYEMSDLRDLIGKLNQSFIPAGVSGVIGSVVPNYRKNAYTEIIKKKNRILDYLVPLNDTSEFRAIISEANEYSNSRVAIEKRRWDEEMRKIPSMVAQKEKNLIGQFNRGLERLSGQTSLFSDHNVNIGAYVCKIPGLSLLAQTNIKNKEGVIVENNTLSFIVGINGVRNNYVYTHSDHSEYTNHFMSMAVDLLASNLNNEMIFIDVKGLGSGYSRLNMLTSSGKVKIWSTASQVASGLDELEAWISTVYRENLNNQYDSLLEYNADHKKKKTEKYVFINDLYGNIDKKEYEKLARIVNNGRKAGVYVISSVRAEDTEERQFNNFYREIKNSIYQIKSDDLIIHTDNQSYIVLKCTVSKEKLDSLMCRLLKNKEKQEIIPVGKYLPALVENWHSFSSKRGLIIPFGIDSNGNLSFFKISSESPYGMIIGDPRSGKSKLMHTFIMMILSNYSEQEVNIAVMDLKNGAEFNVYAEAGIKHIECVLNDEDPDAMLSFLRYYVSEMERRQKLFGELEKKTGVIIQKYEDYRETNENTGMHMPTMPRKVLLIDEFQTLFDGSSSAFYMSELVRKGATYGIHVILSSQRAITSNPRNGFSSDLKDYFTSRFVFKCPQSAAGTVLSGRCADTGKENSGIHMAPLLSTGHSIFNNYMGQNEADNMEVQCFYPSPRDVAKFVEIMKLLKGGGKKVLFKKHAESERNTSCSDGCLYLGNSVRLHHDVSTGSSDFIKDDMTVAFSMEDEFRNIIISGTDKRCVDSFVQSLKHYAETNRKVVKVNLFGKSAGLLLPSEGRFFELARYEDIREQVEVMQNLSEKAEISVNLLIEPDSYDEYAQSPGGLRKSVGVEALKHTLTVNKNTFSVIYTKNFKNLRNSLLYAINECPIRIVSVGDMENVRMSTSENVHVGLGDFDIPRIDSINAYYYNKDSEKHGKFVMYCA